MDQDRLHQDAQSNQPEHPPPGVARLTTVKIMERVRLKLALRRIERLAAQAEFGTRVEAPRPLPRWQSAEPRFESKPEYKLAELLRFDDADFVETAYKALLQRAPDPAGRDDFLSMLRSGHVGKIETLGDIRFSEEGRRCGVHVDGLLLPYKLHQWRHKRIIGPLLGFAIAVFRLPRLGLYLQALEARSARESHELGDLLNRCAIQIDRNLADIQSAIRDLRVTQARSNSQSVDVARAVDVCIGSLQQTSEDVLGSLTGDLQVLREAQQQHQSEAAAQLQQQGASIAVLKAELLATTQALARSDEAWKGARAVQDQRLQEALARLGTHDAAISGLHNQADRDQHSLQALLDRVTVFLDEAARSRQNESSFETQYASFEDTFRGERGEIKQRVAHYLGTLENAGVGPGDGLVLDLGSGRGEWLEVLTEQGYACRGVDLNPGMLKESRARGYDVVETDAIGYLRGLGDGVVAAITAMHLVEHLPHLVLIDLLDESLRVLRPGGLLILETPNPENVRVGACQFYMDPTHLHPIPPLLLQWVVGSRGFAEPVIERLSEHRGAPDLAPVSAEVAGARQINQMIEWFTAPPDYAVIARKRGSA